MTITHVRPDSHPATVRGFTLLELIVVMALLSLLMTGLMSALRTMAQTETKIDQRLERVDALRTTRALLAKVLGGISVARIDMPSDLGKTMMPFHATADSLIWVGILPARPDVGGRQGGERRAGLLLLADLLRLLRLLLDQLGLLLSPDFRLQREAAIAAFCRSEPRAFGRREPREKKIARRCQLLPGEPLHHQKVMTTETQDDGERRC